LKLSSWPPLPANRDKQAEGNQSDYLENFRKRGIFLGPVYNSVLIAKAAEGT